MEIDNVTDQIVQIMKGKDQENIFKDKKVLNNKYIPKKLLYRDGEINQLINRISSTSEVRRNISITGPVGSGKTATILYLFDAFSKIEKFKMIYINCSSFPTYATAMGTILSQLDRDSKVSFSGWSRAMYLTRICQEAPKHNSIVICLDEVDKLLARKEHESAIWNLTEIENVSLIMISNVTNWYHDLDSRIKSRLQLEDMHYNSYEFSELMNILMQRVELGLKEGVITPSEVKFIARHACEVTGDARTAIDLLYHAAEICAEQKQNKITVDMINMAKQRAETKHLMQVIQGLPFHQQVLLLSIANLCVRRKEITTNDAYKMYFNSLKDEIRHEAVSERQLREYVKSLELYSLIDTKYAGRKGRGREKIIFPNFDPTYVLKSLNMLP